MDGSLVVADHFLSQGVIVRRVIAWCIDVVIVTLLCGVAWAILAMFGVLTLGLGFPLLAIVPVIPFAYHWLSLAGPGSATIGQAMMDLTVRRARDLGRPTLAQALISTLAFYLTLAAGVIWLAVALVTTRKRTLHDLLSDLVVVRSRALTASQGFWNIRVGRPYA